MVVSDTAVDTVDIPVVADNILVVDYNAAVADLEAEVDIVAAEDIFFE